MRRRGRKRYGAADDDEDEAEELSSVLDERAMPLDWALTWAHGGGDDTPTRSELANTAPGTPVAVAAPASSSSAAEVDDDDATTMPHEEDDEPRTPSPRRGGVIEIDDDDATTMPHVDAADDDEEDYGNMPPPVALEYADSDGESDDAADRRSMPPPQTRRRTRCVCSCALAAVDDR